jgi:hypothetical protein
LPAAERPGILFDDVARRVGLDFTYYNGAEGNFYIMETAGGGVGVFDFNEDGRMDLFFPNGASLGPGAGRRAARWRLYSNRDQRGFDEIGEVAGVAGTTFAHGAATADFDNDGFEDLYVTGFGRAALYQNQGDGTFIDCSERAAVSSDRWTTSAAFADLDGDGQLDLYVCAYGEVSLTDIMECYERGVRIHCGPQKFVPQPDLLFRNLGDGTFCDVARDAGIDDDSGRGLAVSIADFTGDSRPDIFVANDTSQNFLFINRGNFQFQESALQLGAALTGSGHYMAGMSSACADYDLNGWLDVFVTNFYGARSALFRNLGESGFFEQAHIAGLSVPSHDRLGFGACFLDADLDGHPDLAVANGHVSDMTAAGIPYKMRQQFFHNLGSGTFRDESDSAGSYYHLELLGRGAATVDMNDDGRLDLVVSHVGDPAALLVNRTDPHGHWLGLKLVGRQSNRDAIGTRVRVSTGARALVYEIAGGTSYLSTSDRRLVVGLDSQSVIESLELQWPSGQQLRWLGPAADRYHLLVEANENP